MYRELIEKLIEGHSWAKLQEPCSEKNITNAEKYVGFSFPEELKALLRETNGDRNFLLSADEIISNTKNNRGIFPEFLEAEEFEEKVNRFYFLCNKWLWRLLLLSCSCKWRNRYNGNLHLGARTV